MPSSARSLECTIFVPESAISNQTNHTPSESIVNQVMQRSERKEGDCLEDLELRGMS